MSDTFEMSVRMKANAVRNLAGGKGNAKVRAGTNKGLRNAIVMIEREHKLSRKYFKQGDTKGRVKPQWPFIMNRTRTLSKSYTRELDQRRLYAAYGSGGLKYAKFLEEGTKRGIKARRHMPKLQKYAGPVAERAIAKAIAKELSSGK